MKLGRHLVDNLNFCCVWDGQKEEKLFRNERIYRHFAWHIPDVYHYGETFNQRVVGSSPTQLISKFNSLRAVKLTAFPFVYTYSHTNKRFLLFAAQ